MKKQTKPTDNQKQVNDKIDSLIKKIDTIIKDLEEKEDKEKDK